MKEAPLFRGKRVDNGELVEGDFSHLDNDFMIGVIESVLFEAETSCHQNEFVWHEVDPSTVEQIAGDMVDEVKLLREQIADNPFCAQCPYFESKDCQVHADETCHWTRDMHEHTSKTHEDAPQSTNDHQDG